MDKQNMSAIWDNALKNIKGELKPNIFNQYIQRLVPLSISKNTLILQVEEEFELKIIEARYIVLISNILKEITEGSVNKVEFVLPSAASSYKDLSGSDFSNAPNLMDRYTFDTFVVGEATTLPMRHHWLSPNRLPKNTIRCLSTAGSA